MKKRLLYLIITLLLLSSGCESSNKASSISVNESSTSTVEAGDIGDRSVETPLHSDVGYKDRPIQEQTDGDDDISSVTMIATPNSNAISEVGYDDENAILYVRFRDSGALYAYYEFYDWDDFRNADSLGRYHNAYIRNYYDYEKIN